MESLNLTLKIWRQKNTNDKGNFVTYKVNNISTHASFLEMLDILNEDLIHKGQDPVAFAHDCREGICGSCGCMINGRAHGPESGTATCQLHMRKFKEGETITIEPWRAKAFPVLKDLVVDRGAFDRILQKGGYISVNTGAAQDANQILVGKIVADEAFTGAECIGCGACVAACPNASAMLFVGAKVSQLALLPQGAPERASRVENMVMQMDDEGFGNCTNIGACSAECPKEIGQHHIARLNREYHIAKLTSAEEGAVG
ncbi:MAG: succinate dehydrogenase/fumarate reductase iron-sulfur subunit [Bacteroidetes bacterium]|nr:succinate dehydrogenase/fumarate reductase iron-sulfur subunit [Bacteroidota bacterium]